VKSASASACNSRSEALRFSDRFQVNVVVLSNYSLSTSLEKTTRGPTTIDAQAPCVYLSRAEADAAVARLPSGEDTTCYVNPDNPFVVRVQIKPSTTHENERDLLTRAIASTCLCVGIIFTMALPACYFAVKGSNESSLAPTYARRYRSSSTGGENWAASSTKAQERRGLGKHEVERVIVSVRNDDSGMRAWVDGVCAICLEDLKSNEEMFADVSASYVECGVNNTSVKLPCGHAFHAPCISQWLSRRCECPTCKFNIRRHLDREVQDARPHGGATVAVSLTDSDVVISSTSARARS
jgi:RING-H2 zinc finger domain